MVMDAADKSQDLTNMELETLLTRHACRNTPIPLCSFCEENRVHVEDGVRWQYCERCATELTAASMAGVLK